ncbi:hypothetical protein ACFLW3_01920 [Chloroflexota bacterium]
MVRDLEKAMGYYKLVGIGPRIIDNKVDTIFVKTSSRRLKPKVLSSIARFGDIEFEVVQPLEGMSFQKELLGKRGEGSFYIIEKSDNYNSKKAEMIDKGFLILSEEELKDTEAGELCYFDTCEYGGVTWATSDI